MIEKNQIKKKDKNMVIGNNKLKILFFFVPALKRRKKKKIKVKKRQARLSHQRSLLIRKLMKLQIYYVIQTTQSLLYVISHKYLM